MGAVHCIRIGHPALFKGAWILPSFASNLPDISCKLRLHRVNSWLKTASRLFKFQKEGFWMPPLERQTFLNKATAEGVDLHEIVKVFP